MNRNDYWQECIACAADECGLALTSEQLSYMADAVEGGHENIDQAFYQPENPAIRENAELEIKLKIERSKVGCPECSGRGRLQYNTGPWAVDTGCHKCHGEGKIIP